MTEQKLILAGFSFILYEKSIKVEGIINDFYFARKVTEEDAWNLYYLIKLGMETERRELRSQIINLKLSLEL